MTDPRSSKCRKGYYANSLEVEIEHDVGNDSECPLDMGESDDNEESSMIAALK